MAGILANGHILIEDNPGLAKTLIARLVSQTLDLGFKRIQFTPDLLPSDITGSFLYDQREARFEFRRGPIFTNLLLADEINRATPKTQSALLEAMQESQVTVEGERFPLEAPFLVIATQNPIELEGTYPLPEAQLDRFLMRVSVGYPDRGDEIEILARRRRRREDAISLAPVVSRAELSAMQASLEDVHVAEVTEHYVVDLVQATRSDPRVALGASPRGTLALFKLARAAAAIARRDFVLPDDVKAMAVPALAHRLILKPELWAARISPAQVVETLLAQVPAPGSEAR
jgi:MoxR-like ATPase